MLTAKLAK